MRKPIRRILRVLPVPVAIAIERGKRAVHASPDFRRSRALLARHAPEGRVLAGPFRGMRYVDESVGAAHLPKMFGSYEHELHATIEQLAAGPYDHLIDVGAAEGYYAVGLAMRMPALRVTTFDIDPRGRYLLRRMARLNGVADRVDVAAAADPRRIERAIAAARRPLVICDCEGAEDAVLRPDLTPSLARATILVELHDHLAPGVSGRLRERFAATHDLRQIDESRDGVPAALARELTDADDRRLLHEGRVVRQSWFVFEPTAANPAEANPAGPRAAG